MSRLTQVVEKFLSGQRIAFNSVEGHEAVRFGISTEKSHYQCFVQIDEEREQAALYVCLPNHIDASTRRDMAEFIVRANYGIRIGNFEMDMDDGELRFKCSLDVEGGELTELMVHNMLSMAISCCDVYYGGFMAVAYGGVSPRHAVVQVETLFSIPDEI